MAAASSYFDIAADEDSQDEEAYDETGHGNTDKPVRSKDRVHDSSEEEEDDDDEDARREIAEGFIADEDELHEDEAEARRQRRLERKKRRREEREQDNEALDDEDLDLIGLQKPPADDDAQQTNLKRLKRGHRDDRQRSEPRGVEEIFEDEEDADERRPLGRALADEFDDFIEDDEFPDEEREGDDVEVRRPARHGFRDPLRLASTMDEAAKEDMLAAFGDGQEYDWALEKQEDEDDADRHHAETNFELKDVFEPSQLIDKMLTDEDERIRATDIPERYQIAWKGFSTPDLSEEEMAARILAEADWMVARMFETVHNLGEHLRQPFRAAVTQVLRFMNVDKFEAPFIIANRKDYLIHETENPDPEDTRRYQGVRVLQESDLWTIQELDLEYKAFFEKRTATERLSETLESQGVSDSIIGPMIAEAATAEELQDIHDYSHFQYSAQLKDAAAVEDHTNGTNGTLKRAKSSRYHFEKFRSSPAYEFVNAFGISADELAQSALRGGQRNPIEDPAINPDDMADGAVTEGFATGLQVISAAKAIFAEEMFTNPRMRKLVRQSFYQAGVFDCVRTEKGLRRIDEGHPDYKIKYLRDQEFSRFVIHEPELFLQMLRAEQQGLVEVRLRLQQPDALRELFYKYATSDNVSEIADAWNSLRREAVDLAVPLLTKLVVKGCKESLRTRCETKILEACRREFVSKLDQAPYKPAGSTLGVPPDVLALSNGAGQRNDAICWAYVADNGNVVESGKFTDIRLGDPERGIDDTEDVDKFRRLVVDRTPDVIAVSGWSVEARKLHSELERIVAKFDLQGVQYENDEEQPVTDPVQVHMVNDEVARMYYTSPRAASEHPLLPTLTRYCVALAKYMQGPLKQYAALGGDILSIPFSPHQHLVSQQKLQKYLEMALIEMVNLTGVDVNEAVTDSYTASLLPYVCGLGPRKANALIKYINRQGGSITGRDELAILGPQVWINAASFLNVSAESEHEIPNLLDTTRIHPQDYDLARKMIADALDMDEEDALAEVHERGEHALAAKIMDSSDAVKLQDLLLDDYADDILKRLKMRKRATLSTIQMELQTPFEELRQTFLLLTSTEEFTMLTGETPTSLADGMVVPVSIKKMFSDRIEVKLDCGLEGTVIQQDFPEKLLDAALEPRQVWSLYQSVQAKLLKVDYKNFTANLTMRDRDLRDRSLRDDFREPGQWDDQQEAQDKREMQRETETKSGRAQRVIKHPLYRIMNSAQAEEFLGSQSRGDVVIRPSSKGTDHLAVTWKVSDNVYQHVDVLELEKENEFSVGKLLKVGKHRYSDLDELIVLHIKAMSKKVDEMMSDDKFKEGSKAQTDKWIETYIEANPKSMYAFCINPKHPGYFHLCFKAGPQAPLSSWNVKVIPNAFELQHNQYPDMRALKNGFKLLFSNAGARAGGGGMNGYR